MVAAGQGGEGENISTPTQPKEAENKQPEAELSPFCFRRNPAAPEPNPRRSKATTLPHVAEKPGARFLPAPAPHSAEARLTQSLPPLIAPPRLPPITRTKPWLVPRRPWGRSGQRRPACPSQISSSRAGSRRAVESSCRRGEGVWREGGTYREEVVHGWRRLSEERERQTGTGGRRGERRPGDGRCGRCAAAERMLLTPRVLRLASGPHPGIQRGKGEQVSSHWRRPAVIAGAGFTASCSRSRSRFSTPLPGCWLLSGVRWNKQTAAT